MAGTAARIGRNTVETMQKAYGSRPEDIIAVIGPSVCQNCYEVSEDVARAFYGRVPDFGQAGLCQRRRKISVKLMGSQSSDYGGCRNKTGTYHGYGVVYGLSSGFTLVSSEIGQ